MGHRAGASPRPAGSVQPNDAERGMATMTRANRSFGRRFVVVMTSLLLGVMGTGLAAAYNPPPGPPPGPPFGDGRVTGRAFAASLQVLDGAPTVIADTGEVDAS